MKIKRRKFVKRILEAAAGSLLIPPLFLKTNFVTAKTLKNYNSLKPEPEKWNNDEINIAWIGHSTILINFFGTIILTDPVLYERIGLYLFGLTFGPSRYSQPALKLDDIPKPDIILLSHAHMDHMDYESLIDITSKYPGKIDCVTAYNTKDLIDDLEWHSLKEMDWNDEYFICGVNIKALEVKHFGWRYPWEKDRSRGFIKEGRSFNSYILEKNDKSILFGGDTGFTDKFKDKVTNPIDIAVMPIGAYNPWRRNHCSPEEALIMASQQMNAKYFIPIHCNTFKQGFEPIDEPLTWLKKSSANYDIEIGLNKIGETFNYRTS